MGKPSQIIVVASVILILLSPMPAMAGNHGPAHRPGLPRALLPLLPTAVANAVPDDVGPDSPVQFSSRGSFHPLSGESLTFSWDFGDGNTSVLENPIHRYSSPGTYIAVLRVMDSRGFMDADTVIVNVTESPEPLIVEASILSEAPPGCIPEPCVIQFQATATGGVPPYTFLWDFGDGNTSTVPSPSHMYMMPGSFTVTVT
ncbi:MAG: PKD domain-containing protein, partial [Syntrophobacterales bacterium]